MSSNAKAQELQRALLPLERKETRERKRLERMLETLPTCTSK